MKHIGHLVGLDGAKLPGTIDPVGDSYVMYQRRTYARRFFVMQKIETHGDEVHCIYQERERSAEEKQWDDDAPRRLAEWEEENHRRIVRAILDGRV